MAQYFKKSVPKMKCKKLVNSLSLFIFLKSCIHDTNLTLWIHFLQELPLPNEQTHVIYAILHTEMLMFLVFIHL
jgi:hypothetical protein